MSEQPKEDNTRKCQVCRAILPGWVQGTNCSFKCAVKAYENARKPKKKTKTTADVLTARPGTTKELP